VFVAGSNLKICARSALLTQTLPSACEKAGETKDASVASVCDSFGTDQVCTLPVFLSGWYRHYRSVNCERLGIREFDSVSTE